MRKYPKYKFLYLFFDFLILMSSFYFTSELIGKIIDISEKYYFFFRLQVFLYYFISTLVFLFIFQHFNLYKNNVFLTRSVHLVQLLKSMLSGVVLLVVFTFLFKLPFVPEFSRKFVSIFCLIAIFNFIIFRIYLLQILNSKFLYKTLFKRRVAIIGSGKSAKILAEKLFFEDVLGLKILGFIDDNIGQNEIVFHNLVNLGKISELKKIIEENKIVELIIAVDDIDYDSLIKLINDCTKLDILVKISSPLFNIIPQKVFLEEYSNIPVVNVSQAMNPHNTKIIKRAFDLLISTILIMILLPLFIIILIAIKLTSRGPAIISQVRVGKDGKKFKFYKFRSMNFETERDTERENRMVEFIKNSNGDSGATSKIINEKRVTKVGRILRKSSLDEIPQIYNVIKGDMSLVGPRPSLPYEYENYEEWQKIRHSVLPGCTGVWQVSGRKNVSFRDSVILDLYYVKNMTLWLDVQIMIKTIPAMLFMKGEK